MKAILFVFLFAVCYVECGRKYVPINKNANIDFINMEGGGGVRPAAVEPMKPLAPAPSSPTTKAPAQVPVQAPIAKTPTPTPVPVSVQVTPQKPTPTAPIKPVPVKPSPVTTSNTTPGPGSVKSLVMYYDSKGKASAIRPYSYSDAVKKGN